MARGSSEWRSLAGVVHEPGGTRHPDLDTFCLFGVVLTGTAVDGATWVEDIDLVFDEAGIDMLGPEPKRVQHLNWASVRSVSVGRTWSFPDGRPGTMLDVTLGGDVLRFLVPTQQLGIGHGVRLELLAARALRRTEQRRSGPAR